MTAPAATIPGPSRIPDVDEAELAKAYDALIAGGNGSKVAELRLKRKDDSHFRGAINRHAAHSTASPATP